ncbi:hypothetical protein CVS40_11238 [Lucilia cuprina]|nr:hypothetical protein CVS40_11238 [Lucilia cuprina]
MIDKDPDPLTHSRSNIGSKDRLSAVLASPAREISTFNYY